MRRLPRIALAPLLAAAMIGPQSRARVAGAPAAPAADGPAPSPAAIQALVQKAQEVQVADAAAWAGFRFRRVVVSEKLEDDGSVAQTSRLEFEIVPLGGNDFDERLLVIDGRVPTDREIEEQRGQARFTRHYRTLTAGRDEQDPESGFSLATLLRLSAYRYMGVEEVDGLAAHRLDFEPEPARGRSGIAARLTEAMAGSLWLTTDGLHLVKARAATLRPVSLYLGLSKVRSLEVGLEAAPVAPGVFLPRRLTLVTHARILFVGISRRQEYTYSDFAPRFEGAAAGEAQRGGGCPVPGGGVQSALDEPAPEDGPRPDLRRHPAARRGRGAAPAAG